MIIEQGTIIIGTKRIQDLIPAFNTELKRLDPGSEQQIPDCDDDHPWWFSDDAGCMLRYLVDTLNDLAPDGLYFGYHYGDDDDYGFWELWEE